MTSVRGTVDTVGAGARHGSACPMRPDNSNQYSVAIRTESATYGSPGQTPDRNAVDVQSWVWGRCNCLALKGPSNSWTASRNHSVARVRTTRGAPHTPTRTTSPSPPGLRSRCAGGLADRRRGCRPVDPSLCRTQQQPEQHLQRRPNRPARRSIPDARAG